MLVVDDSILGRYSSIYGRYLTNRIPIESCEAFSTRYEVSSETYFPKPNQKYFTILRKERSQTYVKLHSTPPTRFISEVSDSLCIYVRARELVITKNNLKKSRWHSPWFFVIQCDRQMVFCVTTKDSYSRICEAIYFLPFLSSRIPVTRLRR